MPLSIFIAQAMALTYFTLGLGLILNKDYYKRFFQDYSSEANAMYLGGLIALILGFSIITFHNVWVANWTILITLLGWMKLMKGIFIIVFPKKVIQATKLIRNPENLSPILFLFAGILAYFSLFHS